MTEATVSALGIYAQRGETALGDVFYHQLKPRSGYSPDAYLAVPRDPALKPYVAHRPPEDRADWLAVGAFYDQDYEVVITTETLNRHLARIAEALLDQIDQLGRDKTWLHGLLDAKEKV